ncbi:MAG: hypothetical protein R6W70_09885 [bacterium]
MSFFKLMFYFFIVLFFFYSEAEEGELAADIGGGGFFPLNRSSREKTVLIYASPCISGNFLYGITDNFDSGVSLSWTKIDDMSSDSVLPGGSKGVEYMDYRHINIIPVFRYNVFPGYPISPHITAGAGVSVVKISRRQFYINERKLADYNAEDYSKALITFQGGADIVWRLPWWQLYMRSEFRFSGNKYNRALEMHLYAGFYWFLSSVY